MKHHLAQFTGSATAQNNFTVNGTLSIPDFDNVSASLASIQSATGSYLTSSGSVAFTDVTGKPTLLSSSAQISAEISGAFNDTSASFSTSQTSLSSSLASTIGGLTSDYTELTNIPAGIVSGSTQISNLGFLTSTGSVDFDDVTNKPTLLSSSLQVAGDISGSLGANATLIRSLTAAGISGSFTDTSASFSTSLTTAIANISGAFTDTTVDLTDLNNFTSSIQSEVDALQAQTGSYLTSSGSVDFDDVTNKPTLLSSSAQIAAEISGAFSDTSASFSTSQTSLSSSIAGNITNIIGGGLTITSASYALTASYALSSSHEIIQEVSSSWAETASYALVAEVEIRKEISSSNADTASYVHIDNIDGDITADSIEFTNILNRPTLLSSSTQIATEISGAFTDTSASFSTSQTNLSSSLAGTISGLTSDYTELTNIPAGIVSSSAQFVDLAAPFTGSFTGSFIGDGSGLTNVDVAQVATVNSSYTNQSTITVNHNFNTQNIIVTVYSGSNQPRQVIPEEVILTNNNSVQIDFPTIQTGHVVVAKGGHILSGSAAAADSVEFSGILNKPTLLSSSAQIASEISGAFSDTSASFSTSQTNLSSSLASTIGGLTSDYTELTNIPAGIVSGSTQISDLGFLTSTGSVDFDDVTGKPTLVSSSAQIDYTTVTNIPSGIISSSTQFDTLFNLDGVHSSSAQVVDALENQDVNLGTGAITASQATINGKISGSTLEILANATMSNINSSGRVTANEFSGNGALLTNLPAADYTQLNNVPDDIISGSTQISNLGFLTSTGSVDFDDVTNKPNLISSSAQLNSDISGAFQLAVSGTDGSNGIVDNDNPIRFTSGGEIAASLAAGFITLSLDTTDTTFTSGVDNRINANNLLSSSAQIAAEISGAFNDTQANLTPLNNFTSSIQSEVDALQAQTGSYLTSSGSIDFDDVTNKPTLISGSTQISDLGFLTSTGSVDFDDVTGKPTLLSSSLQIATEITGAFTDVSESLSASIAELIDGTTAVATASYAISSSHEITHEVSSSYADTASFALTASYALNAGDGSGFPFSGSATITGSLVVSQSAVDFTNTPAVSASLFSGSYIGNGSGLTNVSVSQVATVTSSFASSTSHTIDHNFNSQNIVVSVYNDSTPPEQILPSTVELTSNNRTTITFPTPQSGHAVVAKGGHIVSGSVENATSASFATTSSHAITASYALNAGGGGYNTTFTNVTAVTASHNLGSKHVGVFVYNDDDYMFVPDQVQTFDENNVHLTFTSARSGRVVVVQ